MAQSTLKRKIAILTVLNEMFDSDDEGDVEIKRRGGEPGKKGAFVGIFKDLELSDTEG